MVRSDRSMLKRLQSASSDAGAPGNFRRAIITVSIARSGSSGANPARFSSALMKPMSNDALCATIGASPMKSRKLPASSANFGFPTSISSVMPETRVASGSIARSGS